MPSGVKKSSSKGGKDNNNNGGTKRSASSNKGTKTPAIKKNKKDTQQLTLFGAGMEKVDKAPLLLGHSTLFTDAIYGKKVPEEHKDQLFLYYVKSYDAETKEFCVKYRNSMITEDGVKFIHQEGHRAEMDKVKIGTIEEGIELYLKALGRVNAHEKEEAAVAKGNLKKRVTVVTPEEVETNDLDEASIINVDKLWRSQEVLDVSALIYIFLFYICIS